VHRNLEHFHRHTAIFFVQTVILGNGPHTVTQYIYSCYIEICWLEQILMSVSYENIVFCCENLVDIMTKCVGQKFLLRSRSSLSQEIPHLSGNLIS
jgi:hypothetical protein